MRRQGVPAEHSIVIFDKLEPECAFSGGSSFADFPAEGSRSLAYATCYVSEQRDRAFRAELASVLVEAMRPYVDARRIFVSIRPVSPDDFFFQSTAADDE